MNDLVSMARTLLRDPAAVVERPLDDVLPGILAILLGSSALLGAVVGSYRGELQVVYGALKLPLVYLVPAVVAAPVVHALARVGNPEASWTRSVLAILIGATRASLLALATLPLLWLAWDRPLQHVSAVQLVATVMALSAMPGLWSVGRIAMGEGRSHLQLMLGTALVVAGVLGQSAWALRPFVGDRSAPVAFTAPATRHVLKGLRQPSVRPAKPFAPYGRDGAP